MAGIGIAKKGLGLLGRMAQKSRTVAHKKNVQGKTKKVMKTYSTGRRQPVYVRPGQPVFKMQPKMGKKKSSQGRLFSERTPKENSPQLKFKFSYPERKRPLHSLKAAIKKSKVK